MIEKLFDNDLKKVKPKKMIFFFFILSIFLIDYIVYIAGGTHTVYPHLMYIPIILSSFLYGLKRSILVAILAGFALSTFIMPLNVQLGIKQDSFSWMLRLPIFIGTSAIITLLAQRLKAAVGLERKKAYINPVTGLPKKSKLLLDIDEMIEDSQQENHYALMIFHYENHDFINRYIGYETGKSSLLRMVSIASNFFGNDQLYSISENKIVIILPNHEAKDAYEKGLAFLHKFHKPILSDSNLLPVNIILKCGIVHFPSDGNDANTLIQKLGRALGKAEQQNEDIVVYNNEISKTCIDTYANILTIHYAIEHDMFHLVYQPKINIHTNEVSGVEALLRLNSIKINPAQIVKIAEDIGIIDQITKLVIKKAVDQLKKWQNEGIHTKIAVNISSKDLKDDSIVNFAKQYIYANNVDPGLIEFEITERALIENLDTARDLLHKIKDIGIKISLDDFGTGYNSLLNLLDLPLDYVKIDKYFVDHMSDPKGHNFLKGVIKILQNLGREVIAEGVEEKEQVDTLRAMGCDIIQGYYFSKPLSPEKLAEQFYPSMPKN